MKSLAQYIKECLVTEGGVAIKSATRVPAELSMDIFADIKKFVQDALGDVAIVPLGSTGKKKPGDSHGDIDIAIEMSYSDADAIRNLFAGYETCDLPGSKLVSIGWPWKKDGREGVAQCDFMFTSNMPWAKFFFHSPDYRNDSSKFKGAIRTILLNDIIANIPTGDAVEYFDDGQVKTKWKYTFNNAGLFKQFLSYIGKKGQHVAAAKKDKALEQVITQDPKAVGAFLFKKASEDVFDSVESLWKEIHTDNFKYPEALPDIEKQFVDDCVKRNITFNL